MSACLFTLLLLARGAAAGSADAPQGPERAVELAREVGKRLSAFGSEPAPVLPAPAQGTYAPVSARPVRIYAPGNWRVARDPSSALAVAETREGETVGGLAAQLGLDPAKWRFWLTVYAHEIVVAGGARLPSASLTPDLPLAAGQTFAVPNTITAVWAGDLGAAGRALVDWDRDLQYLAYRGFRVARHDRDQGDAAFVELYNRLGAAKALHGIFVTSHGCPASFGDGGDGFGVRYDSLRAGYGLGFVLVNACDGASARVLASPYAAHDGVEGLMIPPFETIRPRDILPPGRQGTRPAPRVRRPQRRVS